MRILYLGYGIVAALLIVFAALLGLRKRLLRLRVGPVAAWVSAHNWLGGLALVLALLHARFQPGGVLTTALLALLVLTAVSGGVGVAIQSILPKLMTSRIAHESPHDDPRPIFAERWREVHEIVAAVCKERPFEDELRAFESACGIGLAPASVQTVSGFPASSFGYAALSRFYREAIVPFFRTPLSTRVLLANAAETTLAFDALRGGVDSRLHTDIDRIRAICDDTLQRAAEARYRRAMEGWRLLHVPLAMLTLVLLFVHAIAAIYY